MKTTIKHHIKTLLTNGREMLERVGPVKYLDYATFEKKALAAGAGHWSTQPLEKRWDYHKKVVEIARSVEVSSPTQVMEMGTMGVQIVRGSHTMDYQENWNYHGKKVTFWHDARSVPWPMEDKQYRLFIGMRVFQYLVPVQREAFWEAKRIAEHVCIVVPKREVWSPAGAESARGITLEQFIEWNGGAPPSKHLETELGDLYYWGA